MASQVWLVSFNYNLVPSSVQFIQLSYYVFLKKSKQKFFPIEMVFFINNSKILFQI